MYKCNFFKNTSKLNLDLTTNQKKKTTSPKINGFFFFNVDVLFPPVLF